MSAAFRHTLLIASLGLCVLLARPAQEALGVAFHPWTSSPVLAASLNETVETAAQTAVQPEPVQRAMIASRPSDQAARPRRALREPEVEVEQVADLLTR